MKLIQKTLALLLVAATLLGLGLTAGAANVEYTDASSINHPAAVDILSGLGVIKGYANGSFKPGSSVTRAEVSKMLAIILNNGEDVGDMYIDACTFDDAKEHWAAGYIGFCVSAGIISGKNASTFDPDGKLSGYALSKLLLCALGYDAKLNGLTGPNWDTTAHSMAIRVKLLDSLSEYDPSKNINRDDTCQMIFNTLLATKVETTGTSTVLGKLTIHSDVKNTELVNVTTDYRGAGAIDGKLQLVEEVLPELRQLPGSNDEFGRPSSTWRMGTLDLGTYATSKPILSAEGNFTLKTLRTLLGNEMPDEVVVYINGARQMPAGESGNYAATNDTLVKVFGVPSVKSLRGHNFESMATLLYDKYGKNYDGPGFSPDYLLAMLNTSQTAAVQLPSNTSTNSLVGSAALSEVYFENHNGTTTLTVCVGRLHIAKVVECRPEVTDDNDNVVTPAYVVLDTAAPNVTGVLGTHADLELTDDITIAATTNTIPMLTEKIELGELNPVKTGDYVGYYSGLNAEGKYVVQGGYLLGVATETVDRITSLGGSNSNSVRGKSKTTYSRAYHGQSGLHEVGKTYDVYYVAFGTNYRFFFLESADADCVYVYNAGQKQNSVVPVYQAKIIRPDGSVEVVDTDVNYGPMGRNLVGSIAAISQNEQGLVVLSPVGEYSGNLNVRASVTNKVSGVNFDGTVKYANESTTFVIGTIDSNNQEIFTVYKGISAVPTISNVQYYAYSTNSETGMLDQVYFINATGIVGNTEQEGVLVKTGKESALTDVTGTYYEMQTVIGQQPATYKVTAALYNALPSGLTLFAGYTKDAAGMISSLNKINGTKITSFAPADAGNITLNGTVQTYHKNVLVYTYSVMRNKLEVATVESLYALNGTYDSFFTRHEHLSNKPLAAIFAVID